MVPSGFGLICENLLAFSNYLPHKNLAILSNKKLINKEAYYVNYPGIFT